MKDKRGLLCADPEDVVTVTTSFFQRRLRVNGQAEWMLKRDLKPLQSYHPGQNATDDLSKADDL